LKKNNVYVGTNYHPHDYSFERVKNDVIKIKKAGFNVVRLSHLCWDSFEPYQGQFEFSWFDKVLDLFEKNEIDFIIDIPTRPAPIWLHRMFPSINISNEDGVMQRPISRYMEDVGDPYFQKYAFRFAEKLIKRYKSRVNLLAYGLCNEIGAGYQSYSETAERRFQQWLSKTYGEIDKLNFAWATQRWSRRLNFFEEAFFPISSTVVGSPESFLDMKRFFSDELGDYLIKLQQLAKKIAPNVITTSNHWAENPRVGFDYQKYYKDFVDIPAVGFYPGLIPEDEKSISGTCMNSDYRIAETGKNIWAIEFQTGTTGGFGGPRGMTRMYCYLSLIYRNAMVCAWTWDSMTSGEEQYIFGLLNHDSRETYKLQEYEQFAKELDQLEKYAMFPRKIKPRVAVASSYESDQITSYAFNYYKTNSHQQVADIYNLLFKLNVDSNIIDLRTFSMDYDILIIPGIAIMDDQMAKNIRYFVKNGGTVIMTAYSAKVNENSKIFSTPLPGCLTDVFGIQLKAFDRAYTSVPTINEGGAQKKDLRIKRKDIHFSILNNILEEDVDYYELIECETASVHLQMICDGESIPGCTMNNYGKGKAYYLAIPVDQIVMKYILKELFEKNEIIFSDEKLVTRKLGKGFQVFINTSNNTVKRELEGRAISLLEKDSIVKNTLILKPFEVEIIRMENDK
jgi:beta-galactosidase